ncbi:thioredoxin family protein [Cupriavidus sp. amp6]|uniref:thioredoxin family protein n=1 Tax=Cupriavidus sp. amp6 TaxID=388051 RepID=UPI000410953B|nr:thioredoxin family protein [Cupriavidus sp. amp6]
MKHSRRWLLASLPQLAASQQGKPFVLVVWSLDCVYCKRNFEAIGKLRAPP